MHRLRGVSTAAVAMSVTLVAGGFAGPGASAASHWPTPRTTVVSATVIADPHTEASSRPARLVYATASKTAAGVKVANLRAKTMRWIFRKACTRCFYAQDRSEAWAPDRSRIALEWNGAIYTVRPDGESVKRLTLPGHCGYPDHHATWSPSSRRIAFQRATCESEHIWKMHRDGSHEHRLFPGSGFGPDWSPTGGWIAFFRNDGHYRRQIWISSTDGATQRELTTAAGNEDHYPSNEDPHFSSDGRRLLYTRWLSGFKDSLSNAQADVCVLDIDPVPPAPLPDTAPCLTSASGANFDAHFAPGGHRIVFVSNRSGNRDLWIMSADGTQQRRLTTSQDEDFAPEWSPNGRWIAFLSDRSGNNEVYVIHPDGTGLRRLTHSPASEGEPSWEPG